LRLLRVFFFFQAEDGIRDSSVTGVQTCALPISACGGDAAAVEKLLVVCQPDLRRFARRACSSGDDAEDAVQIALWQLYRKIGALRSAAALASWLFRVLERECYPLFYSRAKLQAMDASLDDVLPQQTLPVGF